MTLVNFILWFEKIKCSTQTWYVYHIRMISKTYIEINHWWLQWHWWHGWHWQWWLLCNGKTKQKNLFGPKFYRDSEASTFFDFDMQPKISTESEYKIANFVQNNGASSKILIQSGYKFIDSVGLKTKNPS